MDTTCPVKLLLKSHFLHSSRHCVLSAFCTSASLGSPKGGLSDKGVFLPTTGPSLAGGFKLGLQLQQQYEENRGVTRRAEEKGAVVAWSAQGARQPQQAAEERAGGGSWRCERRTEQAAAQAGKPAPFRAQGLPRRCLSGVQRELWQRDGTRPREDGNGAAAPCLPHPPQPSLSARPEVNPSPPPATAAAAVGGQPPPPPAGRGRAAQLAPPRPPHVQSGGRPARPRRRAPRMRGSAGRGGAGRGRAWRPALGAGEGAGPGRAWRRLRSSAGAVAGWLRGRGGGTPRGAGDPDFQPAAGPERVSGGEGRMVSAVPLPAPGSASNRSPPRSRQPRLTGEPLPRTRAPAQAWGGGGGGVSGQAGPGRRQTGRRSRARLGGGSRGTVPAGRRPGRPWPLRLQVPAPRGARSRRRCRERWGAAGRPASPEPLPRGCLPGWRGELRPRSCKKRAPVRGCALSLRGCGGGGCLCFNEGRNLRLPPSALLSSRQVSVRKWCL